MTQTYVFGGQPAQPSMVSYSALALTADTALQWPWVDQDTASTVPLYLYVTPTGAFSITMPDATGAANGQATIIFNVGPSTITILDSTGGAITTIDAGIGKYVILRDNSAAAGTWQSLTFGAGTNAADAASLAGYGLSALSGATLNSNNPVVAIVGDATATAGYRAQIFEVTSATGAGTLSFDSVSTLGNGWWMGFSNLGSGAWNLDPNGSETIDGQSGLVLNPTETCLIFSSGGALFTIGRGRSVDFVYTALNKDVAGNTDVTLTSTEASNLLIKFFGALTGNINVIVPSVVNEYMIRNATTGSFTLTVKTAAGAGVVATQGAQAFVKCDGTDCYPVVTDVPVTGTSSMPDGSASLPGLAFANEQTTGFFRASAGVMGLSVLGNQVMGWTASLVTSYQDFTVVSVDAGATAGPIITAYRNSASPAANDIIGAVNLAGNNSTPTQKTYASVRATILDKTAASEDATLDFYTQNSGTLAVRASVGQGLVVGAAADGGAGTITTTGAIASGSTVAATTAVTGASGTFSSTLAVSGSSSAAPLAVSTSNTGGKTAEISVTDAGAAAGPSLFLTRASASPAASDLIGNIPFAGLNSAAAATNYAKIYATIVDPTSTSEDGKIAVQTVIAGSSADRLTVGGGVLVGSASGGDKGIGTLNAGAYYINGVAFTPFSSSGVSIQTDSVASTTYQTCSTAIPDDDSIPQITEGDEVLSLSFTPKNALSTLYFKISIPVFNSTTVNACAALFNNSSANSICSRQFGSNTATFPKTVEFEFSVSAVNTAARTYSVRVGPASGAVYINGNASARRLGGVQSATMTITEVAA